MRTRTCSFPTKRGFQPEKTEVCTWLLAIAYGMYGYIIIGLKHSRTFYSIPRPTMLPRHVLLLRNTLKGALSFTSRIQIKGLETTKEEQ